MRNKLLSTLSFFALGLMAISQGTLQFNQIKLVSSVETVPSGKVWKVTSAIATSDLSASVGTDVNNNSTKITIDGITCHLTSNSSWTGANSYSNANPRPYGYNSVSLTALPIWLPAGATLAAGTNVGKISLIEFNIVP